MITQAADPVLLFYPLNKLENGDLQAGNPVPVYLSEEITGLCVDSETDSLNISTDFIPVLNEQGTEAGTVKVQQRGETQSVSITLIGNKNSIGLNIILPMLKSIFSKVFAGLDYKIAYFHQNVLIFNARLASYQMTPGSNDTKVSLTLNLEVVPENSEKKEPVTKVAHTQDEMPGGVA